MQENLILGEENYIEVMEHVVTPYLKEREQEYYWEREEGKAIHCLRYTAEAPKGVVVISHGFTESAEKYKEVLYYFVKEQYHVYMPEHCGHGKSYRLVEDPSLVHVDTWERYVDDLLFVVAQAREEYPQMPFYLYAHSMGGGIGAAAAGKEPGYFEKVILTSPMIRPLTGGVPWDITRRIASAACRGRRKTYYVSGRPYDGGVNDSFEDSSSLSQVRFEYYQNKRRKQRELQTNGASFGWLDAACNLNEYLHKEAAKRIRAKVILFQAELEHLVSKEEQFRFVEELKAEGCDARIVLVKGAKHEIFNAKGKILEKYWKKVFAFLEETGTNGSGIKEEKCAGAMRKEKEGNCEGENKKEKEIKYDDKVFFEKYSEMERSKKGLEGAGEWYAFQKLMPDFAQKSVLDLGCGYGWHCRYAVENGAASVLGTDISHRMLERAEEINADGKITYRCAAMEELEFPKETFDIVLSSLAFHYVEDFPALVSKIKGWLKAGGSFVFSVEHPVFTAYGTQDWYYDADGNILHFPVDNYYYEGKREAVFLGEKVTKYHRTVTTYINTLLQNGFEVRQVVEPQPSESMMDIPGMKDEMRRPMMLLVLAVKKPEGGE